MIYDITPTVSPDIAVWPGDTPPRREVLMDMSRGDNLTLSTLRSTVHLGAHADAPSHYGVDGTTIDERPLERYLGPAQLIRLHAERGTRIAPGALPELAGVERVLLSTGTFPDSEAFNEDFAALSTELIEHLRGCGVTLIGVDTPSVDLFDSKPLPAHRKCLEHDIAILEGLALARVPEGLYELIALPLRLVGFDASPVRAVLRTSGTD